MEIIQIASDKKGEIWFFDKQEKKLIKIDGGIMQNINGTKNIPIAGIIMGGSSILLGLMAYFSYVKYDVDCLVLVMLISFSLSISYMYARHYLKKVEAKVRSVGHKYDFSQEVLSNICKSGVKAFIAFGELLVIVAITGFVCIYVYIKSREIRMLILGILSIYYLFSGIIILHPVQKLLFWIRVKTLYRS